MSVVDVFMPISIIGSFGAALYFFTRTVTDYNLKKKMIEKGYVNDDTQAIFKTHTSENRFTALKWGLILLSAGISLIIIEAIDAQPDSTLPYGIFTISLSLGFLLYYLLVRRHLK